MWEIDLRIVGAFSNVVYILCHATLINVHSMNQLPGEIVKRCRPRLHPCEDGTLNGFCRSILYNSEVARSKIQAVFIRCHSIHHDSQK